MSSYYFKIEIYGINNFGCPEFNLMGYENIEKLISDCWNTYYREDKKKRNSQTKRK